MRITGFEIARLSISLKKPFITALRRVDAIDDIIIKIHTDSEHVGYAEACAVTAITGTTNEKIINELTESVFPMLIDTTIEAEDMFKKLYAIPVSSETKACVDIALFDLLAKQAKLSLHRYLGARHSQLQTDLTISVNEPLVMQNDTLDALSKGFNVLKIKLDRDIDKNIERLARINEVLSDQHRLRLDPNQSLSYEGCIRMIASIRTDNIECIEQPFPADDLVSMKRLKENSPLSLLADESIFDSHDAQRLLDDKAVDMLNIKLMKCGGLYEALKISKLAARYDKQCMIGSMLEGPISLLAAVHFGLSQQNISMADLDSPLYLQEHPLLQPFHLHHDMIKVDENIGLGIDAIMESLDLFS